MKKFATLLMMTLVTLTSISCSNDDPAVVPPPPPATAADGFVWTINGATTSKSTLTANYNLQGSAMNLFTNPTNGNGFFEINLTGSTPGTYTLGNGNGFYYSYSASEDLTNPTSGSVTITSFANNKVSGTFTAAGTGTGVTSISGTFTNIGL